MGTTAPRRVSQVVLANSSESQSVCVCVWRGDFVGRCPLFLKYIELIQSGPAPDTHSKCLEESFPAGFHHSLTPSLPAEPP